MKKLLGISLIAVLAVSPMMAVAADTPVAGEPTHTDSSTNATGAPRYALKNSSNNDTKVATGGYVKGAYNAAIKAINRVDKEANDRDGTLSSLTTTAKDNLVAAINEVKEEVGGKQGTLTQGNGITISSGTISAKGSNGITVDSAGIKAKASNGITVDSNGIGVKAYDGIKVDSNGVSADLTSKGGLKLVGETAGSKTIGVDVDGSSVKINTTSGKLEVGTIGFTNVASGSVATSVAATGSTSASKLTTESAVRGAIDALDATKSQTAASANGNLSLSITETDGKITAISGSVTHPTFPSLTGYATKEGAVATIKKATGSKTGASLAVSGTPTGTIANTITQGSISTTVSVPKSGTVQTLTTWDSDTTLGTAAVTFTNENKTVSANVTGANVTSAFTGTGITSGTATGDITGIAIDVDGYYENASDTTAETFTGNS